MATRCLYYRYKVLCTATTRCLYYDYKVLVLALQDACTGTTNGIVLARCQQNLLVDVSFTTGSKTSALSLHHDLNAALYRLLVFI